MLFKSLHSLVPISATFLLMVYTPQAAGQNPSTAEKLAVVNNKTSRPSALRRTPTEHELVVPFWTLEPGWGTQLEVRNNLAHGVFEVTPVLRMSGGSEVQ